MVVTSPWSPKPPPSISKILPPSITAPFLLLKPSSMPSFHQDSTAAIASFYGKSPKVLSQLQYIQNSAARLLTLSCDHITSVLHRQPRLSVPPAAFNSKFLLCLPNSTSVTLLTVAPVLQMPTSSLHHSEADTEPGVTAAGTHSSHIFKDAPTHLNHCSSLHRSFKFNLNLNLWCVSYIVLIVYLCFCF